MRIYGDAYIIDRSVIFLYSFASIRRRECVQSAKVKHGTSPFSSYKAQRGKCGS